MEYCKEWDGAACKGVSVLWSILLIKVKRYVLYVDMFHAIYVKIFVMSKFYKKMEHGTFVNVLKMMGNVNMKCKTCDGEGILQKDIYRPAHVCRL